MGKRTLRSFMCLLLFTWLFYMLSGFIAGIALLYEPYQNEFKTDNHFEIHYDIIVNGVLVAI